MLPEHRAELLALVTQRLAAAEEALREAVALAGPLDGGWADRLEAQALTLAVLKDAARQARLDVEISEEWAGT